MAPRPCGRDSPFTKADEENFLARPGAWGVVSPGAQLFPAFWSLVARVCLHPEEAAKDPELRLETWNLSQRLQKLSRAYRPHPAALLKAALAALGLLGSPTLAPGTEPASPAKPPGIAGLARFLGPFNLREREGLCGDRFWRPCCCWP